VKKVLMDLLKERLATPDKRHGDFLDEVVHDLQSGNGGLTSEKFAADVVAALLFASYISVSSSLTVAMKYLSENPNIVQSLKVNSYDLLHE
jgi:cytochrome P450